MSRMSEELPSVKFPQQYANRSRRVVINASSSSKHSTKNPSLSRFCINLNDTNIVFGENGGVNNSEITSNHVNFNVTQGSSFGPPLAVQVI